jgi:hypothetical protein
MHSNSANPASEACRLVSRSFITGTRCFLLSQGGEDSDNRGRASVAFEEDRWMSAAQSQIRRQCDHQCTVGLLALGRCG